MTAGNSPPSVDLQAVEASNTASLRRRYASLYAVFLALAFFPALTKLVNYAGHSLHDTTGLMTNLVSTVAVGGLSYFICLRSLTRELQSAESDTP